MFPILASTWLRREGGESGEAEVAEAKVMRRPPTKVGDPKSTCLGPKKLEFYSYEQVVVSRTWNHA